MSPTRPPSWMIHLLYFSFYIHLFFLFYFIKYLWHFSPPCSFFLSFLFLSLSLLSFSFSISRLISSHSKPSFSSFLGSHPPNDDTFLANSFTFQVFCIITFALLVPSGGFTSRSIYRIGSRSFAFGKSLKNNYAKKIPPRPNALSIITCIYLSLLI